MQFSEITESDEFISCYLQKIHKGFFVTVENAIPEEEHEFILYLFSSYRLFDKVVPNLLVLNSPNGSVMTFDKAVKVFD